MAEQAEENGLSQRAAAMAAFQKHSSENSELGTHKESSAMTQREKAMAALNHKGVVNQREMKGLKGETQHAQAMKNLKIDDQPAKVVPNWKQTAAQKTANAVRKEIGSGASSARAMFQKQEAPAEAPKPTVAKPAKSFVPVATTTPVKRTSSSQPGQPPSLPSPVSSSVSINTASEAELMVDHDLSLLVAGIKRLVAEGKGTQDEDGSMVTTFGAIVDDEELEQQLESLVGTLKAGRKRGAIDWKGQLLLKGPDDAAPVKLLPQASSSDFAPNTTSE